MIRTLALALTLALFTQTAHAADLVRFVRLKISAGDLATGLAMAGTTLRRDSPRPSSHAESKKCWRRNLSDKCPIF